MTGVKDGSVVSGGAVNIEGEKFLMASQHQADDAVP
jgi:hypothetical protein